jgi:hypothetical protein
VTPELTTVADDEAVLFFGAIAERCFSIPAG